MNRLSYILPPDLATAVQQVMDEWQDTGMMERLWGRELSPVRPHRCRSQIPILPAIGAADRGQLAWHDQERDDGTIPACHRVLVGRDKNWMKCLDGPLCVGGAHLTRHVQGAFFPESKTEDTQRLWWNQLVTFG